MKLAVIVFPGSNCDLDLYEACTRSAGPTLNTYHIKPPAWPALMG